MMKPLLMRFRIIYLMRKWRFQEELRRKRRSRKMPDYDWRAIK